MKTKINSLIGSKLKPCPSREELVNLIQDNPEVFSRIFYPLDENEIPDFNKSVVIVDFEHFCLGLERYDEASKVLTYLGFADSSQTVPFILAYKAELETMQKTLTDFLNNSTDFFFNRASIDNLLSSIATFSGLPTPISALKHQRAKISYLRALFSACLSPEGVELYSIKKRSGESLYHDTHTIG